MDKIDRMLVYMSIIDENHDKGLSKALSAWAESQQVTNGVLVISLLRIASICMHRMLVETPMKDIGSNDCEIIDAYSDYFHYYVHVAQDRMEKAAKNKH